MSESETPAATQKPPRASGSGYSPPRAPFILLVLTIVTAGIVSLVLLNTAINEDAFTVHRLSEEKKQRDTEQQQLNRDLAELESAGALDAAAKRLGLVDAGEPAFITVPEGEVIGEPQPAGE